MSTIAVFARIRPPHSTPYGSVEVSNGATEDHPTKIQISFGSRDRSLYYSEAQFKQYSFQFKKVFTETSTQEQVYEDVGQQVVEKFLQGYNGMYVCVFTEIHL